MPKKTRRQKMLAEQRRIQGLQDTRSEFVKREKIEIPPFAPNIAPPRFDYHKKIAIEPQSQRITHDNTHIVKDLIRITIFTMFALFFQGVLYFFLRTR